MRKISILLLLVFPVMLADAVPPGWLRKPARVTSFSFGTAGCYPSGSAAGNGGQAMTVTRASTANMWEPDASETTCPAGSARVVNVPRGLLIEPAITTNLVANPDAPATQTITFPSTGYYAVWGRTADASQTLQVTPGTATLSAFQGGCVSGTMSAGSALPCVLNVTAAGTATLTLTSGWIYFQVEPVFYETTTTRTARSADVVSVPNSLGSPSAWCASAQVRGYRRPAAMGFSFQYEILSSGSGANSWRIFNYAGTLYAYVYDSSNAVKAVQCSWSVSTDVWHIIQLSVSSGAPTLYVDGSACGTVSGAGTGIVSAQPATLNIGSNAAGANQYLGLLREVKLSTKACTPTTLSHPAALGDSLTKGDIAFAHIPSYPERLSVSLGPAYDVLNAGVSGYTAAQVLSVWTNTVRATHPPTVIVLAGTNDVALYDTALATVETNLSAIYDQALADGAKVIAMTVPPWTNWTSATWTSARQTATETLNTWIRAQAAAKGIVVVDLYADFDSGDGTLKAAYDRGDHAHLSPAGKQRQADLVYAAGRAAGYW